MKTVTRFALLLALGLGLTGCASNQATDKSKSASAETLSLREKTEGGNDHWFQRNLNDKIDRDRGQP